MKPHLFSLGFFLVMVFPGESSTVNREFTLYPSARTSWNHAAQICESADSQLITIDSYNAYNALVKFSKEAPWKAYWSSDFWTGLHNFNGSSSVDNFVWFGCKPVSDFTAWKNTNSPRVERCVAGRQDLQSGSFWGTRDCDSTDPVVICEKITGDCKFYHLSNRSEVFVNSLTAATVNCFTQCTAKTGALECWGAEVWQNDTTAHCKHFLGPSYKIVHDFMETNITVGAQSYIKSCFQAKLNETSFTRTQYSSNEAWMTRCLHTTTTDSSELSSHGTSTSERETTVTALTSDRTVGSTVTPGSTVGPTLYASGQYKNTGFTEGEVEDDELPCVCPCETESNLTIVEKKKLIDKLISDLSVNKSSISSNQRKFYSANDPRPSAQRVGAIGIVLLSAVFGSLILMDFQGVVKFVMLLKYKRFLEKEAQRKNEIGS